MTESLCQVRVKLTLCYGLVRAIAVWTDGGKLAGDGVAGGGTGVAVTTHEIAVGACVGVADTGVPSSTLAPNAIGIKTL